MKDSLALQRAHYQCAAAAARDHSATPTAASHTAGGMTTHLALRFIEDCVHRLQLDHRFVHAHRRLPWQLVRQRGAWHLPTSGIERAARDSGGQQRGSAQWQQHMECAPAAKPFNRDNLVRQGRLQRTPSRHQACWPHLVVMLCAAAMPNPSPIHHPIQSAPVAGNGRPRAERAAHQAQLVGEGHRASRKVHMVLCLAGRSRRSATGGCTTVRCSGEGS